MSVALPVSRRGLAVLPLAGIVLGCSIGASERDAGLQLVANPKTITEALTNLRKLVEADLPFGTRTFTRSFVSRYLGGDHVALGDRPDEQYAQVTGFSAFQRAIPTDGPALHDAEIDLSHRRAKDGSNHVYGRCNLTAPGNSVTLQALRLIVGHDLTPVFLPPLPDGTPFTEPITEPGGNAFYFWPVPERAGELAVRALIGGDATLRWLDISVFEQDRGDHVSLCRRFTCLPKAARLEVYFCALLLLGVARASSLGGESRQRYVEVSLQDSITKLPRNSYGIALAFKMFDNYQDERSFYRIEILADPSGQQGNHSFLEHVVIGSGQPGESLAIRTSPDCSVEQTIVLRSVPEKDKYADVAIVTATRRESQGAELPIQANPRPQLLRIYTPSRNGSGAFGRSPVSFELRREAVSARPLCDEGSVRKAMMAFANRRDAQTER